MQFLWLVPCTSVKRTAWEEMSWSDLGKGQVAGSLEHANQHAGSLKWGEILTSLEAPSFSRALIHGVNQSVSWLVNMYVPCQYTFLLMNITVTNAEIFQIHLHTILTQRISATYADQMPTFHVSGKVHSTAAPGLSTIYHAVWQSSRWKNKI